VRKLWQLDAAAKALREDGLAESSEPLTHIRHLQEDIERKLDPRSLRLLGDWYDVKKRTQASNWCIKFVDAKSARH